VLIGARYWLVERIQQAGAFRRFRADAPPTSKIGTKRSRSGTSGGGRFSPAAHRPRHKQTQTAPERSTGMHYIAVDLDTEAWVKSGLARLERYLACWRLFNDRYPA
jgi:hypothetical protein